MLAILRHSQRPDMLRIHTALDLDMLRIFCVSLAINQSHTGLGHTKLLHDLYNDLNRLVKGSLSSFFMQVFKFWWLADSTKMRI